MRERKPAKAGRVVAALAALVVAALSALVLGRTTLAKLLAQSALTVAVAWAWSRWTRRR